MLSRVFILVATLSMISGCIATPRIELSERIDFDAVTNVQPPMSYEDLLCCVDCTA